MKSQKGITLISVTVYIIGLTIAISIITVLTAYFSKNINKNIGNVELYSEYTNFDSFFSQEVNHNNITVLECEENYIVFDNQVQYTFVPENKGIYRNKVKICRQIENCTFTNTIENGKYVVTVEIEIKGLEKRTIKYTLKN